MKINNSACCTFLVATSVINACECASFQTSSTFSHIAPSSFVTGTGTTGTGTIRISSLHTNSNINTASSNNSNTSLQVVSTTNSNANANANTLPHDIDQTQIISQTSKPSSSRRSFFGQLASVASATSFGMLVNVKINNEYDNENENDNANFPVVEQHGHGNTCSCTSCFQNNHTPMSSHHSTSSYKYRYQYSYGPLPAMAYEKTEENVVPGEVQRSADYYAQVRQVRRGGII